MDAGRRSLGSQRYRTGGVLMIAGQVVVIGVCARHVLLALATGVTPGRMGAVHSSPEAAYFASIAAGALGMALGALGIALGFRWVRRGSA